MIKRFVLILMLGLASARAEGMVQLINPGFYRLLMLNQYISFIAGGNFTMQHTTTRKSNDLSLGFSIGRSIPVSVDSELYDILDIVDGEGFHFNDFNWGLKYKFLRIFKDSQTTTLNGVNLYLAFNELMYMQFDDLYLPTPVSFVLGGGVLDTKKEGKVVRGGYIEAGLGFIKFAPVSIDLMYRFDIHNNNNVGVERVSHNISLEFVIL